MLSTMATNRETVVFFHSLVSKQRQSSNILLVLHSNQVFSAQLSGNIYIYDRAYKIGGDMYLKRCSNGDTKRTNLLRIHDCINTYLATLPLLYMFLYTFMRALHVEKRCRFTVALPPSVLIIFVQSLLPFNGFIKRTP